MLDAAAAMTGYKDLVYKPNPDAARIYAQLYGLYTLLHDSFGIAGTTNDLSHVMKDLLEIKREVMA